MNSKYRYALLVLALGLHATIHAQDTQVQTSIDERNQVLEEMLIMGVRADRYSKGATGLTMEISETPQSISVITSEQLENFAAHSLNDALKLAPGLNVEEWETNRTNYTSRGFEIRNTQIDGVGIPNNWGIVTGALDSYGYEKIEVIRGANGLLTGVGNSAGTINYVRKRPTNDNEGELSFSAGSYDFMRVEGDYSVLLTEDGSWAARVIVAAEDKESYLDELENDRAFAYAVVDGQLTDNSILTLGASYQDANTDSNLWGALVFNYTDGTQAEWDTNATTAQDWTMWDTLNSTAFIEYAYTFENNWEVKASYNIRKFEDQSKLFYVYGAIDRDTGLGLYGWPGRYGSDNESNLLDVTALGEFSLFGKTHEMTIGASSSTSDQLDSTHPISDLSATQQNDPTPAFPYALDAIDEPIWSEETTYADIDVTLNRVFGSTRLNFTDNFFIVAGFNAIEYTREGLNRAVEIENNEEELSPYIGATFSINDNINAYFSYSDIYQPQEEYDYDGYFLAPTKGVNFETGLKTRWFDEKLIATFAVFTAEQDGLASFAGVHPDTGQYYYDGINVESEGFEIELAGRITNGLNASLAYTNLDVDDDEGNDAHEWAPRDTVNLLIDYSLPEMSAVKFGIGAKWRSNTLNTDYAVEQDAYLLVNTFVNWQVNDSLGIQANINNLTDEKYITSLQNVGYYGAPLNGDLSLTYSF